MNKKTIFTKCVKDLTISAHFTIRRSLIKKIEDDSKKYNLTKSKIVDLILYNYYKNK